MKKSTRSRILVLVVLAVAAVPAVFIWSAQNRFAQFQQYFEDLAVAAFELSKIDSPAYTRTYRQDMETWIHRATLRMNEFYEPYETRGTPQIRTAIPITRAAFDELFELKLAFAAAAEPLYSERMLNLRTLGSNSEYQWRTTTLEELDAALLPYHHSVRPVTEKLRTALLDSNLPGKYRAYAWQYWESRVQRQLEKLEPEVDFARERIVAFTRFYDFMQTHKDGYRVRDDGEIAITNRRYVDDYREVRSAVGAAW